MVTLAIGVVTPPRPLPDTYCIDFIITEIKPSRVIKSRLPWLAIHATYILFMRNAFVTFAHQSALIIQMHGYGFRKSPL